MPVFEPHRPAWQERLPKGLRTAAEWQFGMHVLASLVSVMRGGELFALPLGLALTAVGWMVLTGVREDRRIESPTVWWSVVVLMSGVGAAAVATLAFDPPPQ